MSDEVWMKPATSHVTNKLTVTVRRAEETFYWFHGYDAEGRQFEYKTNSLQGARDAIRIFEGIGFVILKDNKHNAPLHQRVVGASEFELADDEIRLELATREQESD